MNPGNTHRRLLTLLCLTMGGSLALLAGCGALLPDRKAQALFESHVQVAEAFDRIVPGMTRADDLPNLGFDTAKATMLSTGDIEKRAGAADPAVRDCVDAGMYCTGFDFHAATAPGLFQGERPSGDVVLLVMNGRVVHKVFSTI